MKVMLQAALMAWKDYRHEKLLSACAILSLAAALTPLLTLMGVHYGIVSALTEKLLQDPRTLEVTPVGSGKYTPDWFKDMQNRADVSFVMPQTRSIAATISLRSGESGQGQRTNVSLIATGRGDPLLIRYHIHTPTFPAGTVPPDAAPQNMAHPAEQHVTASSNSDGKATQEESPRTVREPELPNTEDRLIPGIVISSATAQRLAVLQGDLVTGYLERTRGGKREAETFLLRIEGILPPEAQDTEAAFVALPLLVALEEYRDGKAVPFFGWPGDVGDGYEPHSIPPGSPRSSYLPDTTSRSYPSFRLYAAGMDDVEPLRRFFLRNTIEVYVRSAEIETVRNLDRAFTVVFSLIAGAALFGLAAATASSSLASVRRKSRSLGIIRLMGFPRSAMLLFPILQSLFTGLLGFILATTLYMAVAFAINTLFAASVPDGMPVCHLPAGYAAAVFAAVFFLSALASAGAALRAASIQPSEVIRDL